MIKIILRFSLAKRIPAVITYCCSHIKNVGVYESNISLTSAEEFFFHNMAKELTIRVGRHMLRDRGRVGVSIHIRKDRGGVGVVSI